MIIDINQQELIRAEKFKKFGVWNCKICNKAEPAIVHQKRKTYCSKECMAKGYSQELKGSGNPNYRGAGFMVCVQCNNYYFSYNKKSKFCSIACRSKNNTILEMKNCLNCKCDFQPKSKESNYCSVDCSSNYLKINRPRIGYIPRPRRIYEISCLTCSKVFKVNKLSKRKYCSYKCHLDNGGATKAGMAAVMAIKGYGAKKDANHNEIFDALRKLIPAKDLSAVGCGVPDGIGWVNNGWHFFDVKNPKTSYGKRGLNPVQKKWAENWKGGGVYLIYTVDEAISFAKGNFDELQKFP